MNKSTFIIAFLVLGLSGPSSGFLDALIGLLAGGRGRFRAMPYDGLGFMGPIIPGRRRLFDPLPPRGPIDVQYASDPYNEDPHHQDCQEPGAPLDGPCPSGTPCNRPDDKKIPCGARQGFICVSWIFRVKCQVGYECVTVSSIKSKEEHLCNRDHVGHCECAAGCMYKNRFIPLGRHRRPVEIAQCEWCQCLQHHDHGHADCFKDCGYSPVHEHRDLHYRH